MFFGNKIGWIGVDVGASHLKVAQLVRQQNQLQLVASAIVPRSSCWDGNTAQDQQTLSTKDEMRTAVSLRSSSAERGFQGRRAAATLSMSLCQLHQLDQSLSQESKPERVVRKAIETVTQQSAAHLQVATWPAEAADNGKPVSKTNVLAVPTAWSEQICTDIANTGWSCQLLDGVPLALARAVALVHGANNHAPTAALDWGFSQATLNVIVDGRPVYARRLKDCSLQRLLTLICTELNVSQQEAQQLLLEHGLSETESTEISVLIGELLSAPMQNLVEEIQRTFAHLQGQRRTVSPQSVYLFGGGATIRGLAEYLTQQAGLVHRVWSMDANNPKSNPQTSIPSCLLGPAIALSALAWEKS